MLLPPRGAAFLMTPVGPGPEDWLPSQREQRINESEGLSALILMRTFQEIRRFPKAF